jgi:hypothetical protein
LRDHEGEYGIECPIAGEAWSKGGRQTRKHWRKLEKGKKSATKKKHTDEESFGDDTKFVIHLLKSVFRKLQDVGETFDIKVPHEAYKDPSVKGLSFRIHGLAKKVENHPLVNWASHIIVDDSGSDVSHGGDDGSNGSHDGDDSGTTTLFKKQNIH